MDKAKDFIKTISNWGYVNPLNPREIIIDDVVALDIGAFGGAVHLRLIRSFEQKQGHGTAIMQRLNHLADQMGVAIELDPKPLGMQKGRIPMKKLIGWYRSLGFQGGQEGMVRQPHQMETFKQYYYCTERLQNKS